MRSVHVLQALVLIAWVPFYLCSGTDCPLGKFGWRCRYDCLCDGPCDTVTGECDDCTGLSWGQGCLLNSSCTYNDVDGSHYQGKRGFGDDGGRCLIWDPAMTGYTADRFPDADLRKAGGYCRNPDLPSKSPWCYSDLNQRRWVWCTISPCPCPGGRFGVNCESECHCSDDENTCNSSTGVCLHGCHPDFQGSSCQECRDKRFGKVCKPCHCRDPDEVCDKATGNCQSGCSAGWTGQSCASACESGRYGLNCMSTCSDHCEDPGVCNKETGTCTCQAGYEPPTCHNECESGEYGLNCLYTCSDHCEVPGVCNKETGTCTCQAGYQPPTCHNACERERYGMNCMHTCSGNCANPGVCKRDTGSCICQAGYKPLTCHKTCEDGKFGKNCTHTCNCLNRSEVCEKTSGVCTESGCSKGWYGRACQIEYRTGPDTAAWGIAGTFVTLSVVLLILVLVMKLRRSSPRLSESTKDKIKEGNLQSIDVYEELQMDNINNTSEMPSEMPEKTNGQGNSYATLSAMRPTEVGNTTHENEAKMTTTYENDTSGQEPAVYERIQFD